jgi:hypothetical protein
MALLIILWEEGCILNGKQRYIKDGFRPNLPFKEPQRDNSQQAIQASKQSINQSINQL